MRPTSREGWQVVGWKVCRWKVPAQPSNLPTWNLPTGKTSLRSRRLGVSGLEARGGAGVADVEGIVRLLGRRERSFVVLRAVPLEVRVDRGPVACLRLPLCDPLLHPSLQRRDDPGLLLREVLV